MASRSWPCTNASRRTRRRTTPTTTSCRRNGPGAVLRRRSWLPGKPSEQALRNRAHWDRTSDEYQDRHRDFINRSEPRWGIWQAPEAELQVLGDVAGMDVLELGCGAAQWSILLAQRGARMVALDNSARQLEHARKLMAVAVPRERLPDRVTARDPAAGRCGDDLPLAGRDRMGALVADGGDLETAS